MASPRNPVPAWNVLIAGGGAAGLSLALALTQALGPSVAVAICDPSLRQPRSDGRAYAVSPSVVRMLDRLGIWGQLQNAAQPVTRMTITDSRLADAVRPDYLTFGDDGSEPLAHMVPADRIVRALLDRARAAGIALDPEAIVSFAASSAGIVATQRNGTTRAAALLVAADGARSRLRDEAGIGWMGRAYGQTGIVATIAHERDHGGRAIQHFLPSGPFAILPLVPDGQGRCRSSLVWAERSDAVPALLRLDPAAITHEIESRAGPEIGAVTLDTDLQTWPLAIGQARRSVGNRFALLGDAAHQVHPLAGHGLNLALGDVAALAERIVDAVRLGLDPGGAPVLEGYERDRRAATLAMAASTDLLNALFSNDNTALRVVRDLGLGLVHRAAPLKRAFIGEATQGTGSTSRLLRGEAL